jgi:predicted O-methyltransferase YrrM
MANEVESVRQLTSEIEGCISDAEGELLYRLAKAVPEGQAIVEVGRGKGKSTVWLAKGSEAGEKNKVYSIASHKGSPNHIKVIGQRTKDRMSKSRENHGEGRKK